MRRKIVSILLAALMILPLAIVGSLAAPITADTSWYDASKSEFVITTAAQLLGMSKVGGNYSGKTIKLGADITVNTGDAASWATAAPETVWTPVSGFAGTFDGDGHTVSGLYAKGMGDAGMFDGTAETAVIRNFRLVNSYFYGTFCAGAVTAAGGGTYERIYSDAITASKEYHAGGIFGLATKPVTVRECWFDGKVSITMRYAGGIVGNGNNQPVVIEHCLNSGEIYTSQNIAGNSHIAGMCGRNDNSTVINDCLNTGLIHSAYQDNGNNDVMGSVFGSCAQNLKTSVVKITNSYGTEDSCPKTVGNNSSSNSENVVEAHAVKSGNIFGYNAYFNTTLDFNNFWAVNSEGSPILMCFAETVPPLYNVNVPAVSDMELKAEGHWGPRWTVTLYLMEGMSKENVKIGALVVPTKALPDENYLLTLDDDTLSYRGKDYKVANVPGEILRESDDQTMIATFVITNFTEKTVRSEYTVRPYAIYTFPEGEFTVYGNVTSDAFYVKAKTADDAQLREALDADLKDIDAAIGEGFVISPDWSTKDVFEEVPALVADDTVILPAVDKGCGEYTITVDGTEGQYADYVALLESLGFTKVYDNGDGLKGAVFTSHLVKDDLLVTVTDVSYQNKTYVSAMFDQPLSEHLYDNFKDTAKPGAVITLSAVNCYYWGDSYVVQLKNGHFVVIDGAGDLELGYLLDHLESLTPAGEKPVIEGWFNTHLHYDHFYILHGFNTHPEYIDRVYVEGVYFNEPAVDVKDLDKGVYPEIANERLAISKLKTTKGTTPEIYRPMMGQRYWFCDVSVDILLSQEQIPLEDYTGGFNDSSTWYLVTMDGQTFIEGGDGHNADMAYLMKSFEPEDLRCDFWSILHHGYNTWDEFTQWVGEWNNTLLFPSSVHGKVNAGIMNTANKNLIAAAKEYYISGEGTDIFYIPYTIGVTGTNGGHVKLPDLPSHKG